MTKGQYEFYHRNDSKVEMKLKLEPFLSKADLRRQEILDFGFLTFNPDSSKKSSAEKLPEYKDFDEMALAFFQNALKHRSVCSTFQGKTYWSCEMKSLDDFYKQEFGKTPKELYFKKNNDAIEAAKMKLNAQQEERKKLMQQFYDQGLKYIGFLPDEGEWRYWLDLNCVNNDGTEMPLITIGEMKSITIKIMKCLSEEDFQQAANLFSSIEGQPISDKIYSAVERFYPKCCRPLQRTIDDIVAERFNPITR